MPRTHTRPQPLTSCAYVPVRRCQDEQRDWLDAGAQGLSPDQAREKAHALDNLIPAWAARNPVIRIARVTLTEEAL